MRNAAFAVIREIGRPDGDRTSSSPSAPQGQGSLIEMNPACRAAQALASKATGFPSVQIARSFAPVG